MIEPSTEPGGDEPRSAPVPSTRTRRVVFGLAVGLLVLVGGGAAVLAITTDAGREGDDRPVAGAAGASPSASAPQPSGSVPGAGAPSPGAGAPSGGVPPAQPGSSPAVPPDDAFRPLPRLCQEEDFSPVFDIVAQVELLNDNESSVSTIYQRSCTFRLESAGSAGTFQVDVAVYSSPDEAQRWFDDILTAESRGGVPQAELAGDWDANAVLAVTSGPDQADVRFLARDETLLLNVSAFVLGEAADERAQQAAVVEIAAQLRERSRA